MISSFADEIESKKILALRIRWKCCVRKRIQIFVNLAKHSGTQEVYYFHPLLYKQWGDQYFKV